ncbi:RNA-directed DNA polymerase [Aeromonas media]|uniref:RNA-directed DNA polymerase n=1 Tax=Aeromonas media TaxID=651 RepID=UPI0013C323DC|nr:reverse transcriptase domain-containing protein [Aeromonas media]
MKQLDRKYYNLKPAQSNLNNKYILGLAWKKTDSFIRSHNWYADLLSLDKYTLNISREVNDLAGNVSRYIFENSKLTLIPAPKSAKWSANNEVWEPKDGYINLRPLSDISIKDQTIATAILMCVADALESRQKNCGLDDPDYTEQVKNTVVSYGNRLICDWEDGTARFRWGGSEFYRKYSSDYRTFLQRPISIGRYFQKRISTADEIYVVHLDLANFYGSIKIELLIEKLKAITASHLEKQKTEPYNHDTEFWNTALNAFHWTWSDESLKLAKELDISTTIGLPQGLASSGALSNAYLIDFDEKIIGCLQSRISDGSIVLHDYCRYVDDLRFVISGTLLNKHDIQEAIEKFVQEILDENLSQDSSETSDDLQCLRVNHTKTQIFELSNLDNWSSLTNRVNELQSEIGASCIAERNTLDSSIPALQQLLQTGHDDTLQDIVKVFPGLNLGSAIKVDSLRRFSAHRLSSALVSKSKLISPVELKKLENEANLVSQKLIYTWLNDPSNMILLRKAIEIYPSTPLYEHIIKNIFHRVKKNHNKKEKYVMIYLLLDIFRSVADLYRRLDKGSQHDYKKLVSNTTIIAQQLLSIKLNLPSYIYRQVHFYLIVVNQPFLGKKSIDPDIDRLYRILGKQFLKALSAQDGYLFEIAAQITGDYPANAQLLLSYRSRLNQLNEILESYAYRGGRFWRAIWSELIRTKNVDFMNRYRWAMPKNELIPNSNSHFLSTIICFTENPFRHEHALLKLGIELVALVENEKSEYWRDNGQQLSPHELKLEIPEYKSWTNLWRADTKLTCIPEPKQVGSYDPRYQTPDWLEKNNIESNDFSKIYWICSVLRCAALGNSDFTQRNDLKLEEERYYGIVTQWFKRRMGMLHSPECIVGTFGTISDWFSHLLQHGLQWPGFSSSYIKENDILSITNLHDFKNCLKNRLDKLNANICISSDIPTLPTVVNRPELAANLFRVVTVQQLFPKEQHFHRSDVTLDDRNIRWKHREHLAEVCKLTEQTLSTKLKAESQSYKSTADLIVFSELAVHPDDEDIVRGLALRTKSIVFAGFVFSEHNGKTINKARWIIPDKAEFGMQWRIRDQGKQHMTPPEVSLGIEGYRPCQHIIEIEGSPEGPFKLTGAICYDATDIRLAADLRDQTDMFVISAHNKDVSTFDNMASALQWHMYQHIIIANTGEYGGSTMQAPYKEKHHKLISHAHGTGQIAISTADIDLAAFRRKVIEYKKTKAEPAGFNRKH